jgi:hypothetical protein
MRLEPCEGKLSSTVLRGGSGSNAASLPDKTGKPQRQPLWALSRWHLALSLAAGQVSGVVSSNDGRRVYVIKGDVRREVV